MIRIVKDHFFMRDPDYRDQCRVHVPIWEAGQVVGACCGYPESAHQPIPSEPPNAEYGESSELGHPF